MAITKSYSNLYKNNWPTVIGIRPNTHYTSPHYKAENSPEFYEQNTCENVHTLKMPYLQL